jgi:hypothetical protein
LHAFGKHLEWRRRRRRTDQVGRRQRRVTAALRGIFANNLDAGTSPSEQLNKLVTRQVESAFCLVSAPACNQPGSDFKEEHSQQTHQLQQQATVIFPTIHADTGRTQQLIPLGTMRLSDSGSQVCRYGVGACARLSRARLRLDSLPQVVDE